MTCEFRCSQCGARAAWIAVERTGFAFYAYIPFPIEDVKRTGVKGHDDLFAVERWTWDERMSDPTPVICESSLHEYEIPRETIIDAAKNKTRKVPLPVARR